MSSDELRRCPFCGGKAEVMHMDYGEGYLPETQTVWGVFCESDLEDEYPHGHYIDNYATKEDAIRAWNGADVMLLALGNMRHSTPAEQAAYSRMLASMSTPTGVDIFDYQPHIRCKYCRFFLRDATPHDDECPHFCRKNGFDMADDDGSCSWAERMEDE